MSSCLRPVHSYKRLVIVKEVSAFDKLILIDFFLVHSEMGDADQLILSRYELGLKRSLSDNSNGLIYRFGPLKVVKNQYLQSFVASTLLKL